MLKHYGSKNRIEQVPPNISQAMVCCHYNLLDKPELTGFTKFTKLKTKKKHPTI